MRGNTRSQKKKKIGLKRKARFRGLAAPPFLIDFCATPKRPAVRVAKRGTRHHWETWDLHWTWREDCIGWVTGAGFGFLRPRSNSWIPLQCSYIHSQTLSLVQKIFWGHLSLNKTLIYRIHTFCDRRIKSIHGFACVINPFHRLWWICWDPHVFFGELLPWLSLTLAARGCGQRSLRMETGRIVHCNYYRNFKNPQLLICCIFFFWLNLYTRLEEVWGLCVSVIDKVIWLYKLPSRDRCYIRLQMMATLDLLVT